MGFKKYEKEVRLRVGFVDQIEWRLGGATEGLKPPQITTSRILGFAGLSAERQADLLGAEAGVQIIVEAE